MNIFERNAKIIVVLAVILGSTSGILGKLITANSMAIGFYRLTFALPFFAVPVIVSKRDLIRDMKLTELAGCGIAGIFLFGHFFFWFKAVQTTTVASAIVLQSLHPIVVLLVTVFAWKHKVGIKPIIGILAALAGGAIIAGFDYTFAGDSFAGDIFAILAGTFMGLYFCAGNVVRKNISAGIYVFLVFLFCWLAFLIGMFATKTPFTGYPAMDYVWLIVMTLTCQIGAHAVFNWSLGYVTSLYMSAWETAEIIFASLLALFVFKEIPTMWQIIGGIIVLVGLLYYNKNESAKSS